MGRKADVAIGAWVARQEGLSYQRTDGEGSPPIECQTRALRLDRSSPSPRPTPGAMEFEASIEKSPVPRSPKLALCVLKRSNEARWNRRAEIDHNIGVSRTVIGVQPIRAVLGRFGDRPGLVVQDGRCRERAGVRTEKADHIARSKRDQRCECAGNRMQG